MSTVQDREYQVLSRDRSFERWQSGDQATLVILPTGCGKTVVAGMIARKAKDEFRRRTLFLAHREELINQAADKLGRFDLECAIEMGEQRARDSSSMFGRADVVIATVQTLQKRRLQTWDPNEFGVIMTDEAHHARARTYKNIYDYFGGYWHLGITATPDRGDGANLGAVYQSIAFEYKLRDAIKGGYLVPLTTARLETSIDLDSIRTTGGDYNAGDLEEKIGPFIEQLARALAAEVGDRQTVVFTPDVGSAEAMADALSQLGIPAESVSGKMQKTERRGTLRKFTDRDFQVICCCDLLTEGWDEPQVSCVVICRPTKKRNRYAQMIGRGTRPHPSSGKTDCLVIDFAWRTTSGHELCTTVDLFDDSELDDEVLEVAERLMKDATDTLKDPQKALDEAEEIVRERRKFKVRLTGKTPKYEKFLYDPVGVGSLVGVTIKQGWDYSPMNPATVKQTEYLRKLGVDAPEGLSKQGAGKLIDKLSGRLKAGLATPKQVGFLLNLGVEPGQAREMTFLQASQSITELLASKRNKGR